MQFIAKRPQDREEQGIVIAVIAVGKKHDEDEVERIEETVH